MEIFFVIGAFACAGLLFFFGAIFGYISFILFSPLILFSIVLSIIYIGKSVKEKKFRAGSLCAVILILAAFCGSFIDSSRTKKTISDLKQIKEYVVENYVDKINDEMNDEQINQLIGEDEYFKQFKYGTRIGYDIGGELRIEYHDAWCHIDEEKIHLRPRP